MPRVSIVIPTYNSAKTLAECLQGIRNQTYPSYEVVVVDNFSDDGTAQICSELNARVIQRKCNPALARNIGTADSVGKYVLFLDSDQVLSPTVIEECVDLCESESFAMIRIPEFFAGKSFWDSCSAAWKNCYYAVEQRETHGKLIVGEPRFFLKRAVLHAGMFNESLLWGENYELHDRLKRMGIEETLCRSELFHYEPASIKTILIKNFRYGESMPSLAQHVGYQIFALLLRHSWLTFKELFKGFRKSPVTVAGCTILLVFRAYFTVIGLVASSLSAGKKGVSRQ